MGLVFVLTSELQQRFGDALVGAEAVDAHAVEFLLITVLQIAPQLVTVVLMSSCQHIADELDAFNLNLTDIVQNTGIEVVGVAAPLLVPTIANPGFEHLFDAESRGVDVDDFLAADAVNKEAEELGGRRRAYRRLAFVFLPVLVDFFLSGAEVSCSHSASVSAAPS